MFVTATVFMACVGARYASVFGNWEAAYSLTNSGLPIERIAAWKHGLLSGANKAQLSPTDALLAFGTFGQWLLPIVPALASLRFRRIVPAVAALMLPLGASLFLLRSPSSALAPLLPLSPAQFAEFSLLPLTTLLLATTFAQSVSRWRPGSAAASWVVVALIGLLQQSFQCARFLHWDGLPLRSILDPSGMEAIAQGTDLTSIILPLVLNRLAWAAAAVLALSLSTRAQQRKSQATDVAPTARGQASLFLLLAAVAAAIEFLPNAIGGGSNARGRSRRSPLSFGIARMRGALARSGRWAIEILGCRRWVLARWCRPLPSERTSMVGCCSAPQPRFRSVASCLGCSQISGTAFNFGLL